MKTHPTFNAPMIEPLASDEGRPFWSVMIPTYNRCNYLEKLLKLILADDPGPEQMQIEVVDDCSQKNDPEAIVREVGKGRVNFYRQPKNQGLMENLNICLERARGRWVQILPDDDLVLPGFYSTMRAGLELHPQAGAGFCRHIFVDEQDRQTYVMAEERATPGILENLADAIAVMQRIQIASLAVRREVYEKLGGFRPEIGPAADWEMWKRIAVNYPFYYEPKILACFRVHGGSESSRLDRTAGGTASVARTIEAARAYLPAEKSERLTAMAADHYARSALQQAVGFFIQGQVGFGMNQLREALLLSDSPGIRQIVAGPVSRTLEGLGEALTRALRQYQKKPGDEKVRTLLVNFRRELASGWLSLPDLLVQRMYEMGLGRLQAMIGPTGRSEPAAAEDDAATVEKLKGFAWAQNPPAEGFVQNLLAAMLYPGADQLPASIDLPRIPNWLVADYRAFLLESR